MFVCHIRPLSPLQTPLAFAVKNGHTDIVAMLLTAKRIDVNKGVNIVISTSPTPNPALPLIPVIIGVMYALSPFSSFYTYWSIGSALLCLG